MAPRANWKGYLRLSLVSCPIEYLLAGSKLGKLWEMPYTNLRLGSRVRIPSPAPNTHKPPYFTAMTSAP